MVQMDSNHSMAPKAKDFEIDLEKGVNFSVEDSDKREDLFSKICGVFVDSRIEGVNSSLVSKLEEGDSNVDPMVKKVVKEKRKKSSNKKPPKPPRPPRGPSLDLADQKLIKEIAEIAMLKKARVERMKTLKKMKGAKPSSSISNVFAMVFTVLFFVVILFQGMSSSRVNSVNVQAETPESDLIAVQYGENPSSFGPPDYVKSVAGFESVKNRRTAAR